LRGSDYWSLVELESGQDGGAALLDTALSLPAGKGLFGLFGSRSDGAFEAPVPANAAGVPAFTRGTIDPSLATAVQAAATVLSRDEDGFFLLVEQGDIDWANHGNDATRMIGTIASLDEAVREAMAFIEREGDAIDWSNSLVIVTADHATGLPRFPSTAFMAKGERPTQNTVNNAQWDYAGGSLTYSSTGHGNELVGVSVMGDEAQTVFGSRMMDNTAIFTAISDFAGL
jgi:alkaline phosphatase